MKYGQLITLDNFTEWIVDGKINGKHIDADEVFHAIQSRTWECPVCKEEGHEVRIDHSLEATIDVGNPICEEGHDMELLDDETT